MIKYYLDREAYEYLNEWSEQYKTKVKYCPEYHKKVQVILKTYEQFRFFVESTLYGYKFNMLDENGLILKGKITHEEDSERDFDLNFNLAIEYNETIVHIMQVFCTAFLEANCFMWCGNIVDNRKYAVAGRTQEKDKIFTFRKYKDSVYAVAVGHHRSPEGVFEARGHFRCYRNGKVIWIDPYLKGLDE